jgi:hypothetical protein
VVGKEDLDPDNTSSQMSTVLNTIKNKFQHECLEEGDRLRNDHTIRQSADVLVPGPKHSIPGLPRTKFLVHYIWAIWYILRRWVLDADVPGVLVADQMGLGNTVTLAAAAITCSIVTEKVGMGLPLSTLCGNTHTEWVNMVQNDCAGIISKEW